jgi:hypothetical protein
MKKTLYQCETCKRVFVDDLYLGGGFPRCEGEKVDYITDIEVPKQSF